jgi:hypothetical protein
MNLTCQWPADAAFRADLTNADHVAHLLRDLEVADELIIRYRDEMGGRRPRPRLGIMFRTASSARPRMEDADQCRTTLTHAIAVTHGVSEPQLAALRPLLARRGLDLPVTIPVLAVYGWLALRAVQWVNTRFDRDEPFARWVSIMAMGLGVSIVAVLIGGLWSGIAEIIYVGNEHLSTRATHIAWPGRAPFACAIGWAAFAILAAVKSSGQTPTRTPGGATLFSGS